MFLPALMYALVTAIIAKDCMTFLCNFLRQLPVVNIWQNYKIARKIREYEKIIAGYLNKAKMTRKRKIRDKFEAFANLYSQKLDELKSKHQIFKGYQAVFESGFQFILQIMIVFSKAKAKTIMITYVHQEKYVHHIRSHCATFRIFFAT